MRRYVNVMSRPINSVGNYTRDKHGYGFLYLLYMLRREPHVIYANYTRPREMDDKTTQISICIEEIYRDWKKCSDNCHIFPVSHKEYVKCVKECGDMWKRRQDRCMSKHKT